MKNPIIKMRILAKSITNPGGFIIWWYFKVQKLAEMVPARSKEATEDLAQRLFSFSLSFPPLPPPPPLILFQSPLFPEVNFLCWTTFSLLWYSASQLPQNQRHQIKHQLNLQDCKPKTKSSLFLNLLSWVFVMAMRNLTNMLPCSGMLRLQAPLQQNT